MDPQRKKKRNVKKLYKPPPEQDYTSNYVRLIIVILISLVFIGGQVVAGIIADSIAIISDAIHLVSDLIAFIFSFLFLYLSKKSPTSRMTFGYHRMELLGALANIFIIWFLIIFVMYEASFRIIDKNFVQKPFVMLIAAGAGLVVNIIMYKVLHGGATHSHGLLADACHGHEHGHQHGHEHEHQCEHSSGHDSEHSSHQDIKESKKIKKSIDKENRPALQNQEYQQDICKDDQCNSKGPGVHYHDGSTNLREPNIEDGTSAPLLTMQDEIKPEETSTRAPPEKKVQASQSKDYCEQQHLHLATCYLKPQRKVAVCRICCGNHEPERHNSKLQDKSHQNLYQPPDKYSPIKQGKDQNHPHEHEHHHGHDHKHHQHHGHDHKHHSHHGHDHDHHSHHEDKDRNTSIGMQAAILHALSDMIMSVGLVISSIVIFFLGTPEGDRMADVTEWNPWHLFDPIATFVFSIVSLASTIPVIKNSYYLMMESTPTYIDIQQLQQQFEEVQGVIDVHDIHVWDLKPGKTMVIAHVLAKTNTERQVLIELSDIARKKKIYHSTFQVEQEQRKQRSTYILCHHDIH